MRAVMMGGAGVGAWMGASCLFGAVRRIRPPSLPLHLGLAGMGGRGYCPHLSPVPAGTSTRGYLYHGLGGHSRAVGWRVV